MLAIVSGYRTGPHSQPGHVLEEALRRCCRLLSKYCAEFIELIPFLIAVAFAERPAVCSVPDADDEEGVEGSVRPCISAALCSFFCMTVRSERFSRWRAA